MLALFDRADDATRELLRSLATAGITVTPVVIQYDGELPEGSLCPFTVYTGLEATGEPLFFDEVPVPTWCEIRHGREPYGEILRDGVPIGRIHYEPNSFRQVERVDWLLADGTLAYADHYDRHGRRYATTHFADGAPYETVYEGPGEWAIAVHHQTKTVVMRAPDRRLAFETLTDFVSYFLDDLGLATEEVLINSLSTPLFVARKRAAAPTTTLFWQEPTPTELPGNMTLELEEPRALRRIVFADERVRRRVAERHPGTPIELGYLSHIGQFAEKRGYEPRRAFTLTNTDEIPALEGLLAALPDVTFSVAALTLMSDRLHELARRHPNLELHPTITHAGIAAELDRASVYLDINAGAHVLDAVKAAYYLDLVVLALAPHAKAPDQSIVCGSFAELRRRLEAAAASPEGRARALDELHTQRGPLSTAEDYRRVFGPG